jgi:hypothetical protein
LDIDLSLDAEALGEGEYKTLVDCLIDAGYHRGHQESPFFQLQRLVSVDDGEPIVVILDLLMPREARFTKNRPPLIANFAVQKADGAGVAMRSYTETDLKGTMPDGRSNALKVRVASIPALLVMKGYALCQRNKQKDAYDIYYSVRQFEGGPHALAEACRPLLQDPIAMTGYQNIASKFTELEAFGPQTVRRFLGESQALGEMTEDQVQQDAFAQVRAWLDELGV